MLKDLFHTEKTTKDLFHLLMDLLIEAQHHDVMQRGSHEHRLTSVRWPAFGIMEAFQVGRRSAMLSTRG